MVRPRLICHTVDYAALPALPAVSEVYIALGTTIKVAGSQAAFRAVDVDAVVATARAARAAGATRLGVVSAMGAQARSAVFYNRMKGEMEEAVARLGFETVVIARPSFLVGDRSSLEQPRRRGEAFMLATMRRLNPFIPANYRSVTAREVADALREAVMHAGPGLHVLPSGQLHAHETARRP
ncbi:epimerase [Variovorax sp. CYS-02]|uniref:Epimerase n=1 Tax=Variovorax terrae TaxID=2923278 RepID=A0A9X1VR70_9BURK|nr:epimerase [Variovorax terrae]MCJ0762331.1 epimerase [Variovorax terrae]